MAAHSQVRTFGFETPEHLERGFESRFDHRCRPLPAFVCITCALRQILLRRGIHNRKEGVTWMGHEKCIQNFVGNPYERKPLRRLRHR